MTFRNTVKLILSDLGRIEKPTIKSFLRWYFFPQGSTFPYQVWNRLLAFCYTNKFRKYTLGVFVYFFVKHLTYKFGISANFHSKIGPGLFIVHGFGTFINCESIGKNFTVYQNVTLGASPDGGKPIVRDNVTVFAGAVVAGKVVLNEGCVVAANAFVNRDVEANTVVGGIPAKVIKKCIVR